MSDAPCRPDDPDQWVHEARFDGVTLRWTATRNAFESKLYDFPMWDLRVEADGPEAGSQARCHALLEEHLAAEAAQLLDGPAGEPGYLYSKVVRGEPLHQALMGLGFREVERRRLYKTPVRSLVVPSPAGGGNAIRFAALCDVEPGLHAACRGQILELCREAFARGGHSRHFTDPFLRDRVPGLAYILGVMRLNFDRLTPAHFLVALDPDSGAVCGFSVFEKKAGAPGNLYTQLLSAVAERYRGRGVYQGLTGLLRQALPGDAELLNVTHADNAAMRRAYAQSGRVHLADTTVVRRAHPAAGGA